MKSAFDPGRQNKAIESKIVVALEKIAEAFRVLLWNESKENALSPIQIQILIFLLFHEQGKCKISYLASEFNMTKATISDSVKVLLLKKLIKKHSDNSDTRSYSVTLSPEGYKTAAKAAAFAGRIEKPISHLGSEQKIIVLNGLLNVIYELNRSGIITIQRMCLSCTHHKIHNNAHFCELLQTKLASQDLRIDCPEHSPDNV